MADSPSDTALECKRASLADASSSSSSSLSSVSPAKRRKLASPGSNSEVVPSSSLSDLASSASLPLTDSPEVEEGPARSPSFHASCNRTPPGPPASSAPSPLSSGEVVEPRLVAGDHLEEEEKKSFETETSSACINVYFRSSQGEEENPFSSTKGRMEQERSGGNNGRTLAPVGSGGRRVMPSQAEIEELFSAAEKYEQKRFAEKYNYDVVKDVPLEGRYQWVRFNP